MDNNTLRRVQLVQLEIAKEIKRICETHHIEYWLDSGTLLGAIRHKGFIPWDDDMDLGMKRECYEEFLRIAPKALQPNYYLQEWSIDKNYGIPFAKVRKKGTVYIENKNQKSSADNGIYVDIFPYDNYGNNQFKQGIPIKVIKTIMLSKAGIEPWREDNTVDIKKRLLYIPFRVLALLTNRDRLINDYYSLATKYNNQQCNYYYPQGVTAYGRFIVPAEALSSTISLPFEDTFFSCPIGYDLYLTNAYGDYMTPPPENQRNNRHQIIEVQF